MRWTVRFALTASIASIILLLVLKQHLEDLWDQYNVPAYLRSSFRNSFRHGELDHLAPVSGKMGDKIIVMARLERENTDWVAKNLPESALLSPSPPKPSEIFERLLTPSSFLQLAACHLHRQPHIPHRSFDPHKQRPRVNGLPQLHNRSLHLSPRHACLLALAPFRLLRSLAHRYRPPRQCSGFACSPNPFRASQRLC